ncbi:PA domain-containing protein [Actinomadura sp. NPDC049382]|uniref:PA domain-containing protein n=1 Tax=Actinomadura sp. NPDC049382 TaxID=3158220 RepID=UPI003425DA90
MWLKTAAALALGALGLAAPAAAETGPPAALRADAGAYDVTLPTGDAVRVAGGAATVAPAPGRAPAFSVRHSGGDLYVVPDDRLTDDPERYNVTALHERRASAPAAPAAPAEDLVTVRVRSIARDGRPGPGTVGFVNVKDAALGNAHRPLPGSADAPCTDERWNDSNCIRLRPGTYSVMGVVKTMPSWAPATGTGKPLNYSLVGDPEIEITGDTEIVLDARKAEEVTVRTPDHATAPNLGAISHLMWTRGPANGSAVDEGVYMNAGATLEQRVFLQPTRKVRTGTFEVYTRWRLEAPDVTMRARGRSLHPSYYPAGYFSDTSDQFPRLDGTVSMRVADGDASGAGLRGALALVERKDGVPVAEQANRAAKAGARMVAVYNDVPGVNDDPGGYGVQLRVPTVRLSREEGLALLRQKHATVTAKGVANSPYQYDLVLPETGQIPRDLGHVVRTRDLARVDGAYHGGGSMTFARYGKRPWEEFAIAYSNPVTGTPRTRTEYVSADPQTQWSAMAITPEQPYNNAFPGPETPHLVLGETKWSSYEPRDRDAHSWGRAPLTGGVNALDPIVRAGDQIGLHVGMVDAARNFSDAYSSSFANGFTTDFRVYRNGELIAQTAYRANGTLTTTPDDAEYRVEYDFANNAPWAALSTRTATSWTFRSARTSDVTVLPLLQVEYDASLDVRNRTRSRTLRLAVRHQDGSTARLKRLSLRASFDDGATWTDVPVRDGSARLRGKGAVSLRVTAEDARGSAVTQEVIRAYELH